jgi:hypothetical protein
MSSTAAIPGSAQGFLLCYARLMKNVVVFCSLLGAAGAAAEGRSWSLGADSWARPRDGQSVARMTPLPEAIAEWSADTTQQLVIRYPGGEDGQLWAFELRSWLVALGVPQEKLELVAGSQQADRIEIELSR